MQDDDFIEQKRKIMMNILEENSEKEVETDDTHDQDVEGYV